MKTVVVIGGGAAGMMAAISAAEQGAKVTLLEKNEKLGKKLFITGKGRCNLTNACDTADFFGNVIRGGKFLFSSVYSFTAADVMEYFENAGLRLKVERGERVFPESDHSSDVIRTLQSRLKDCRVHVRLNTKVTGLEAPDGADVCSEKLPAAACGEAATNRPAKAFAKEADDRKNAYGEHGQNEPAKVFTKASEASTNAHGEHSESVWKVKVTGEDGKPENIFADSVIIATGGLSYPSTGSTGDGYIFAERFGHKLTDTVPSLVPIVLKDGFINELEGLSLKNVTASIYELPKGGGKGKKIFEEFGEMLFTANGVSGPIILTASAKCGRQIAKNADKNATYRLCIDLKPALDSDQLDKRILRDFGEAQNKDFRNSLGGLLPAKLIPVVVALSGIRPDKKVNLITREERARLVALLKEFPFAIERLGGYNQAVITSGGVVTGQINPSTMESKLAKGLYFAGEVMDVDALTGGFNLQIAFSTGCAAGMAAAQAD